MAESVTVGDLSNKYKVIKVWYATEEIDRIL